METLPYPHLVDARTGIVRALEPATVPAHFPPSFALVTSRLGDTGRFAPWAADPAGAGYAFADPDAVLGAALGEAVERYCGNLVPPGLVRDSWAGLTAAGRTALDPRTVALFSAGQHATPGFPAVPFTPELVTDWAVGTELRDGTTVLVPAGLVWPSYVTAPGRPPTNPVIQAGLACGPDREAALANALREVVERDAMTLSWSCGLGVTRLRPPRWLADLLAGPQGALDCRFLGLHEEFGVRVVAALVHDATDDHLALGVGVAATGEDAALKAGAEALQLLLVLREYDDPAGGFAHAATAPGSPLKPWREDRRYGDAYRSDLADAVDYACHLQLHLDPAVRRRFEAELAVLVTGDADLADGDPAGPADLATAFHDQGFRVVDVDLTTPDVAACGLTVHRVVVPGTYSNAPVGLPFLGGERRAAAVARAAGPLPTVPLPH